MISKKFLALFLATLMIVTSIPLLTLPASAAGEAVCEISGAKDVSINKTYETLGDAFDAINKTDDGTNCGTLTLLKNCTATQSSNSAANLGTLMLGKNVTADTSNKGDGKKLVLDLNGCVLLGADTDRAIFCVNKDTVLTVRDSKPNKAHKYNIESGLYVWDGTDTTGGTTFCGGAVTGGSSSSPYGGGAFCVYGGTLNIEGGNFLGNQATYGGAVSLAMDDQCVKTNISGGTFAKNKSTANGGTGYEHLTYAGIEMKATVASYVTGGKFDSDIHGNMKSYVIKKGYEFVKVGDWYTVLWNDDIGGANEEKPIMIRGVQRSSNTTGSYAIRIIAEIAKSKIVDNSTNAGFEVSVNGVTQKMPVTKYYTKLLAQTGVDTAGMHQILPTSEGNVLLAVVIDGIPADQDIDFYAAPYYRNSGEDSSFGDKVVLRMTGGVMEYFRILERSIGYQTYDSEVDGYRYHVFTIDNQETLRGYFGYYSWLSDNSGFICGTADGSFYFYNVNTQKLLFLDETTPKPDQLYVYVNQTNNKAYYHKMVNGYDSLWCIDPKEPSDREMLFSAEDATTPINPGTGESITLTGDDVIVNKGLYIGLEVTDDGKYTTYSYCKEFWKEYNFVVGRVNLETKKT